MRDELAGAEGGGDVRNDGELAGLGAPSAWREREARGTPKVRTSHRCVGCVYVWTPSRGLCGEVGLEHELVTEHSDFGLSDLARTHAKQRKGSIRQLNAWRS